MATIKTGYTLKDLPAPPKDKTGWPWTEQTNPLPDKMPDGSEWPRISIVTPSYNQGEFIEETIRSVILQGYPNLEYIIIDGGSNDNSKEIIHKYSQWIDYWVSEPDEGQANAINKGILHSTGTILNWVNSDDLLLPGVTALVAQVLSNKLKLNQLAVTYGFRLRINENNEIFDFDLPPKKINKLTFRLGCWIPSETFFFTREIFNSVHGFSEDLNFAIDYDFYVRCFQLGTKFLCIEEFIGAMRFHQASKSLSISEVGLREFFQLRSEILGSNLKIKLINLFCDSVLGKLVFYKEKYRRSIWKYLNSSKLNYYKNMLNRQS
ncbi:glycosyltransferase family 2 protein [Halotia wernerae UHCC 0503]|nr:glycosyltransferase family 2 protein [Halotia wernerae UHCC 0503]